VVFFGCDRVSYLLSSYYVVLTPFLVSGLSIRVVPKKLLDEYALQLRDIQKELAKPKAHVER